MPDKKILSEENRARLDGIVQKMISNKESDETIKFVVEDFKSKYAQNADALKKKEPTNGTGQPSQEASSTRTDRSRSLSVTEKPQDQKVSDGLDGGYRLPTEDDYTKMQEQGIVPVESKESYIARAKKAKESAYSLKQNKAELTKEEAEKTKKQVDLNENKKSNAELLKDLTSRSVSKRKEDADLKLKYYESIPFNDNKLFSNRIRKPAEYDITTQSYIEQQPYDGFVEKYYNTNDLKSLGIDLDDFDGFLERRGLKQLIKTRDERGDFDVDTNISYKEATPEAIESARLKNIDDKATSKQAIIKRALDQYIKEKELKNNDYKTTKKLLEEGVYDPVYEEVFDRSSVNGYVEKNLPNLNRRIQEKKKIDKEDYENIVSKNGNVADEALYMVKNIYRNASEGFGDRVVDMIATTADAIGADSSAESWRDYKYLDELARPSKKLAGIESNLKKVVYNNKTYGVDLKGNIYDVDAEVLVNEFIDPLEADTIIKKAKNSKESTSIIGFQGLSGDFARTMADMGVQVGVQALVAAATGGALNELLLARNITALRNAGISAIDLQRATSVANKLKDASVIDSTVLAEAGITYNEYVAAQNVLSELKSLSAAKASNISNLYADFSKTTKIPVTKDVGDAMIAQGAMGYSSGYEQTLKSARDAGVSEDKARELAETAAKMTAALYAVTTPIQPNIKIKEAIFGDGLRTSVSNAINSYKKGGINSFKNSLVSGLRVLHEEGKKELIQENVQQIGEIYGVNKYINNKAGTKLAQEEYSFNDFLNTSVLSYAAGGLLPGLSAGFQSTAKQNVLNLYNIGENIDKVEPILEEFVSSGKATQEQVDKLKREALAVHRNSTKIPSEIPYEKRTDISVLLEDINDLQEKKKNVDVSFHQSIDDEISAKRKEIQEIVSNPTQQFDLSVKPFEEQQQKPEEVVSDEVANLNDNELITFTVKTLDEVPEQFRDRAKKVGGQGIETRKLILGLPLGKKETVTPYVYSVTGKEAKEYAKQQQQKPEGKNSLSLFQEISEMTNKSQMQEFSKNNPDVAFIHNNIEGIIKGIDGAKVVEC